LDGLEGNWELHLRGNLKGYEGWLERICTARVKKKMKVHGLVENEELLSRIAEHDIGYAGELGEPPSRNLTITNKFFQYLQAGLAVVASDTAGQKEVIAQVGGAAFLFSNGEATGLSKILHGLISENIDLQRQRRMAWDSGEKLCWEKEVMRLNA
jgi:hypothetical protein